MRPEASQWRDPDSYAFFDALSVEGLRLAKPDVDVKFKLRAFGSDDEAAGVLARLSNAKKMNAALAKAFSAHAAGKRTW